MVCFLYILYDPQFKRFTHSHAEPNKMRTVMDAIRHYYASESMTATPYRLEYIYTYTHEADCLMRRFLVETAAVRCTAEGEKSISASLRDVLLKLPELTIDFMEALIRVNVDGYEDPRHGVECVWHRHEVTGKCASEGPGEAWQAVEM